MPVTMPTHLLTLSKAKSAEEFREKVWELVGDAISGYECNGTDVLFATYIEPEQTSGGLYKPQLSQQEILFQGNVGLVLKTGPLVNKYDSSGAKWEGHEIKVNDWIVCRFADCWEIHIDGLSCRLIDPETIKGFIERPEIIGSRPVSTAPTIIPVKSAPFTNAAAMNTASKIIGL